MCYQSHDGKLISIISIYVTEGSPSVSFLSTARSRASLYPRHNGKPISIYATAGSPSLSSLSTSQREGHMYHLYLRHGRKPLSIISIYTMVGNPSLSSLSKSRWETHLYHLYLSHGGRPISIISIYATVGSQSCMVGLSFSRSLTCDLGVPDLAVEMMQFHFFLFPLCL